jgi:hypothetical protein
VTGRNCWKAEKIFFKRSVVTGRAEKPIRKWHMVKSTVSSELYKRKKISWYVSQLSIWVSHFLSLWQNPWHKQLKGGKIYFGPWFHSTINFGPEVKQNIMGGQEVVEQRCSPYGSQDQRVSQNGHPGQDIAPSVPPNDLLPPTRSHLQQFPSSPNNAIKLWIHR